MEQKSGRNAKNLRAENRGLLFRYLMTGRGSSRAELAQISGLTKMTVTNIISEFLAGGLIKESGDGGKARRNNPITLELSADAPKIIAVLIHRTHLSVALCSFTLEILAQESVRITSCDRQTLVDTLLRLTDHMMAYGNILGIGIGSIGPVDIHNGVILNPPDFYGIRDLPVAELFRAHYGLPVFLDYHYNCAALAEKYYGYGKSYSDYLYLGVTDGLSLGIICNNQLFSSFTGYASEIGHLCVNFDDTVPDAGFPGAEGCLGKYVDFGRGPEEARRSMEVLAVSMAGLCNVLNPQALILDNSGGSCPDELLELLSQELNRRIVLGAYRKIDVLKSYRADNFETASCAISVVHQVFQGNLMF